MIVDKDFLAGARTTFKAVFDQLMGELKSDWPKFATLIDTEGKSTLSFSWMGQPPQMRPMSGVLEFGKAYPHDYTVAVTENGVGIEIKESAFMSDPLGTITLFVKNMMVQASRYEDKVAAQKLSAGFATTYGAAFDGKAFYALTTGHQIGDGAAFINQVATNLDNAGAAYQIGWAMINTNQDDAGEPLGLVPTVLVVHPYNRLVAKQMLNAIIISTTSNVLVGDVDLVVSPWLNKTSGASNKEWHLLAGGLPINPILLIQQMPKRFVAQDGLDSDEAFTRNVYRYKVDNKLATGYGDPRGAYASTGT